MNKIDFDAINMSNDEDIDVEIIESVYPEIKNTNKKIYLYEHIEISDVIREFLKELNTNRNREYNNINGGIDIVIDHMNIGDELVLVSGTISNISRMKVYYRKKYIYRKDDFNGNYAKIHNHILSIMFMKLIAFSIECINNKDISLPEYLISQKALEGEMDNIDSTVLINVN
jgi:hypothetical protein